MLRRIKPQCGAGALAVFPDGRVAVGNGWGGTVYDAELKPLATFETPATEYKNLSEGIRALDVNAAGRLYAVTGDSTIAFIRWTADLKQAQAVGGPDFLHVSVEFPGTVVTAGEAMLLKVAARGRPEAHDTDQWEALMRPTDGSDLSWRRIPTTYRDGMLGVVPPVTLRGIYDLAVRFGHGPLALANRSRVPYVQATVAVAPPDATQSIAAITANGRRWFRQGEEIPIQVVRRGQPAAAQSRDKSAPAVRPSVAVSVILEDAHGPIDRLEATIDRVAALRIRAA